MSVWTMTIPVPVWVCVVFVAFALAYEVAAAVRDRAMRDLWRMYLDERYPEPSTPTREG